MAFQNKDSIFLEFDPSPLAAAQYPMVNRTYFCQLTRKITCNLNLKQTIAESGLLDLVNTSHSVISNEPDASAGFPIRTQFDN